MADFLMKYCKRIYAGCLILHVLFYIYLALKVPDQGLLRLLLFEALFPFAVLLLLMQVSVMAYGILYAGYKKPTLVLIAANILILTATFFFLQIFV